VVWDIPGGKDTRHVRYLLPGASEFAKHKPGKRELLILCIPCDHQEIAADTAFFSALSGCGKLPQHWLVDFEVFEAFGIDPWDFSMPQEQALLLQQQHCWLETAGGAERPLS
jgi:hypothetical protein